MLNLTLQTDNRNTNLNDGFDEENCKLVGFTDEFISYLKDVLQIETSEYISFKNTTLKCIEEEIAFYRSTVDPSLFLYKNTFKGDRVGKSSILGICDLEVTNLIMEEMSKYHT